MQRKDTREKLGLKVGDFVLLHVGALNSRKGLFQSIRVLSYLKKNGFDHLKLLAVGQGDQENLKQLTKQWDVEDLVHIAPHNHDIRSFYWASDCFFFPSFYEPFGLVILEAMACGLPVAVSQSCGGAELINHNQNGILFDPHDKPEKIANQLLPIIRNEAKDMAQQARKTSLHHNWDFVGKQYRDFYRQRLQEITQ